MIEQDDRVFEMVDREEQTTDHFCFPWVMLRVLAFIFTQVKKGLV